jgi:hypothetical protein
MKTKQIFPAFVVLTALLSATVGRADDIVAVKSGNWSNPTIWWDSTTSSNQVPGTNDDAEISNNVVVTVDTNTTVQWIYDTGSGTVTMAPGITLIITDPTGGNGTAGLTTFNATAPSNTVIYACNPFWAKVCNYYNLVFINTNYVDPLPPYEPFQNFNNFPNGANAPIPMTIAGDMTVMGYTFVQQGTDGPGVSADISIGGNLTIGTNCIWDTSGANLTVASNVFLYGVLKDQNGALGSNYLNNVIVTGPGPSGYNPATRYGTNGWYLTDVITWYVSGSLTNNGYICGTAYGSISFDGTGTIGGSNSFTIPAMTINGTYAIDTTVVLTTNTPVINGTVVFDLARTNQIVLNAGTNAIWYTTNGTLDVINSGAAPGSGQNYQLFDNVANTNYDGVFGSINLPSLSPGLFWVDNLPANGSITVGGSAGYPTITLSRNGTTLSVSWNTSSYPGYEVLTLTNSAGVITNLSSSWKATGSNSSPAYFTINPNGPPMFFRLRNP